MRRWGRAVPHKPEEIDPHAHYCWECGDWWSHDDFECPDTSSMSCPVHDEVPTNAATPDEIL